MVLIFIISMTYSRINNNYLKGNVLLGLEMCNKYNEHTFFSGKKENEVKEVDKVMYHDWRLIPKHMEQQFKDFEPLPEPPVRSVPYPPLLRAMMLAQRKTGGSTVVEEPALPLKRDVVLNKDYFRRQEEERRSKEGTAV